MNRKEKIKIILRKLIKLKTYKFKCFISFFYILYEGIGDWGFVDVGLGCGGWGWGNGGWALGPKPNPKIPIPQSPIPIRYIFFDNKNNNLNYF